METYLQVGKYMVLLVYLMESFPNPQNMISPAVVA